MLIELPRFCFGREVIEAFKKAFEPIGSSDWQWKVGEYPGYLQVESGSTGSAVRTVGVRASPFFSAKRFGFFDKKVKKILKNTGNPFLILRPVVLRENYREISVDIIFHPDPNRPQEPRSDFTDLKAPEFEPIRRQINKIFVNFYAQMCFKPPSFASFS